MKNLLIWNGMTTEQISGGDTYTRLLVEASENLDLVLTTRAKQMLGLTTSSSEFVVDNKRAYNGLSIVALYVQRAIKSVIYLRKQKMKYRTAVAASPFICDVVPVAFSDSEHRVVVLFHLLPKRSASGLFTKIRFMAAKFEQKITLRIIDMKFDIILTGNWEAQQKLQSIYPHKRILVSHAGINTSRIDQLPKLPKDPNLAVFVGRLTIQKGILDLPSIIKMVQKVNPDFRLVIIGDGPDRVLLEKLLLEESVTGVELVGYVSTKEKDMILKQAKFFLFPSYEEGWGIALAEALYSECIAITYELNHYKGIFENYPIYVPTGSIDEFAAHIIKNFDKNVQLGQKEYMVKYRDKKVVRDIVRQIGLAKT